MSGDPWAGMADPRAALKAAREGKTSFRKLSQPTPEGCESEPSIKTGVCDNFRDFRDFRSPPRPLSHFRGEIPKDRKITCSSSLSNTYHVLASASGLSIPDSGCSGERGPAKVAKPRKYESTYSDCSGIALAIPCESFTIANTVPGPAAHLSGPQEWCDGVGRLDRWEPPCPGFRSDEWEFIGSTIRHFMAHYAEMAHRLGWEAMDLFAVHARVGAVRVDCCGALTLPTRSTATAISADAITFGPTVYRKRPLPDSVLAWAFGADRQGEPA